jgi:hypothetical protein
MVAAAGRVQIALAGRPFGVGDDVIEVAVDRLGTAARGRAGGGPGADKMLQLAAWGVAVLGVPVLTGTSGDGPRDGVQSTQQVGQLCCLGCAGTVVRRSWWIRRVWAI